MGAVVSLDNGCAGPWKGFLNLIVVVVSSAQTRGIRVSPDFSDDPRFRPFWWAGSMPEGPVSWCSLLDGDTEVARAKVKPRSGLGVAYPTYRAPPEGATEIDLIEVRIDLQRSHRGYGRAAVTSLVKSFGAPAVAMSLDEESDGFWRALGWAEHGHEEDDGHRRLFSLDLLH
jgi:hypothetical protein